MVAGSVHLLVTPKAGEPRLIDIVQPGQLFGQAARFGGGPRLLTAIAGEPSQLLHVPDAALDDIARSEPEIWRKFTTLLYAQLAGALQFADLMHQPPGRRIALRLALLAQNADAIAVTQSQLGEMTGLSRKTVNGHLRKLERAGAIAIEYGKLIVRDRRLLIAHA